MKKVIILLVIFLGLFASCSTDTVYTDKEMIENSKQEPERVFVNGLPSSGYRIITLTYQGKQHEYVEYTGYNWFGISHWPDCKYCKEHENNR